ncbi:MAG: hemerythrin family protein [Rhodospirillales bacterium]|jgi:hemerythrin-like metal-binding protein|nr:hemerythrin family protein [Rhodospirillales bacterium]
MQNYFSIPNAAIFDHELIDSGHKAIVDAMNEIVKAFNDDPGSECLPLLRRLDDAMRSHFAEEEAIMETVNYYDVVVHKDQHQDILGKLNKIIESYIAGDSNCVEQVHNLFHIAVTDLMQADLPLKSFLEGIGYIQKQNREPVS